MIGGVAYNPGFVTALQKGVGRGQDLYPGSPEFGAAVGAAAVAAQDGQ